MPSCFTAAVSICTAHLTFFFQVALHAVVSGPILYASLALLIHFIRFIDFDSLTPAYQPPQPTVAPLVHLHLAIVDPRWQMIAPSQRKCLLDYEIQFAANERLLYRL